MRKDWCPCSPTTTVPFKMRYASSVCVSLVTTSLTWWLCRVECRELTGSLQSVSASWRGCLKACWALQLHSSPSSGWDLFGRLPWCRLVSCVSPWPCRSYRASDTCSTQGCTCTWLLGCSHTSCFLGKSCTICSPDLRRSSPLTTRYDLRGINNHKPKYFLMMGSVEMLKQFKVFAQRTTFSRSL